MGTWINGAGINRNRPKENPMNPFVGAAVLMKMLADAFREDKYRSAGVPLPKGMGRDRTPGPVRPAGSKMARKARERRIGL